jgi:hypothetical protein
MRKIACLLSEAWYLIRKDKLYMLVFLLAVLSLVTVLVYQVAPAAIVTFVYAGV